MTYKAPCKPDRFDQAVEHYVAARARYAPELIDWVTDDAKVAGRHVRDLGCDLQRSEA